jgi:hypothetical protein
MTIVRQPRPELIQVACLLRIMSFPFYSMVGWETAYGHRVPPRNAAIGASVASKTSKRAFISNLPFLFRPPVATDCEQDRIGR